MMTTEAQQHEMLPEGESTAKWAIRTTGFLGSIKQILCCARCGEFLRKSKHDPVHYRDLFKRTAHALCDECHDALPD